MVKLEVFDPAMCCSTGVCGPSVDPALARFAADLDWLAGHGVEVRRFNLGQEPGAFVARAEVKSLLDAQGEAALPAVFADGELRSSGRYPARDELASWTGVARSPAGGADVAEAVIAELAAIGAAIGVNCEPCFKYHYAEARKLGFTNEQLAVAVRTAQAVKDVPAAKVLDTAARLLGVTSAALSPAPAPSEPTAAPAGSDHGACCGGGDAQPAAVELTPAPSAKCC